MGITGRYLLSKPYGDSLSTISSTIPGDSQLVQSPVGLKKSLRLAGEILGGGCRKYQTTRSIPQSRNKTTAASNELVCNSGKELFFLTSGSHTHPLPLSHSPFPTPTPVYNNYF
jgi:hypothetical protein